MMGKTSRRAYEARKIRNRARRAISSLERDVAAGVVSESFAASRMAGLSQLIRDNTYDKKSKSYGTSLSVAQRRARAAFEAYSASVSQEFRRAPVSERRKFITPAREAAKRQDVEAALRGELSLEKMEDAEAFIRSTSPLWAGEAPEDRLRVIAEKLGWKKDDKPSLIRAYRRWKRYVTDGEDFFDTAEGDPYKKAEEAYRRFGNPKDFEAEDELVDAFGNV